MGEHRAGHGNKQVKTAGEGAGMPLTPRSGTW